MANNVIPINLFGDPFLNGFGNDMPRQVITRKEKNKLYGSEEKWAEKTIDAIDSLLHVQDVGYSKTEELWENLALIKYGEFNTEKFHNWTETYGALDQEGKTQKIPVGLTHYDIVTNKINLLVGEEISRPFKYRVIDYSDSAGNAYTEEKERLYNELAEQAVLVGINEAAPELTETTPDINNPEEPTIQNPNGSISTTLEDVDNYIELNFTSELATIGNVLLEDVRQKENLDEKFKEGYIDFLATARELYWVGKKNGKPHVRRVDPTDLEFELSDSSTHIEDAEYIREIRYLTAGEIFDNYWELLSEEDAKKIEDFKSQVSNSGINDYHSTRERRDASHNNESNLIRVGYYVWQAKRKIGFVSIFDDDGGLLEKQLVDEEYQKEDNENVEWYYIPETWEGLKIGDDIYSGVQPLPNQFSSVKNLGERKSPYVGIRSFYPFGNKLKQMQYLYNVVWFKLKLAIKASKGTVFLFDINQIPLDPEKGQTTENWMHTLISERLAFLNNMREDGQGAYPFNQFQSQDLSGHQEIQMYINLLAVIKMELNEFTGISKQREGQVSNRETVGGIERSVHQSSAITELYFYEHDLLKQRVLQKIIEVAANCYKAGEKISYILDNKAYKVLELKDSPTKLEDLGVIVSDSLKNKRLMEILKEASIAKMQSKEASLRDLAEVLETESTHEALEVLEKAEKRALDRQQKMQEQQAQMQQQLEEQRMQQKQLELQIEQAKIEQDDKENIRDNETRLAVSQIQAESRVQQNNGDDQQDNTAIDFNNNGELDKYDKEYLDLKKKEHREKLALEKKKHEDKISLEKEKLKNKKSQ